MKAKHEAKSAGNLDRNAVSLQVRAGFDEDTELEDCEAYEEDYEEVLRCLGKTSDDVGAATELRTGHSLKSSQQIRNLHCWLVGEEWSIQDDDKGLDDQVGFFPHQWEKGRLNPPGPEFHTRTTTSVTSAVFDTCACAVAPQPDNFRGASTTTDQDDDMDGGTAATRRTEPSWCMIYVS